ncbi:predicted protein [Sclerotinia sclerotiorum 1980 UF-70]|uniref:Uncharacterized protein n=1 Tax=Sclerotinia sclerotiorum (strain ATCC 18683 / 1980 / Ss-1) TaxID=665079 RepID=A7EYF1_SCLS1|nr:predicted protein [Sclerotinia sclerotiorum 1980 UF-70]EDN94493.1 predicted protein [Sclerotinia sclerotiorum 1980 UF-70]
MCIRWEHVSVKYAETSGDFFSDRGSEFMSLVVVQRYGWLTSQDAPSNYHKRRVTYCPWLYSNRLYILQAIVVIWRHSQRDEWHRRTKPNLIALM